VHHLNELEAYMKEVGGTLDVGQWELHPWLQRDDIVGWCRERGVVIEAYCPLVRAQRAEEEGLKKLVAKHGKTWAQILVRWSLQKVSVFKGLGWRRREWLTKMKGFVPLPKSVTSGRIEENIEVYDFELSEEDMKSLETGEYSPCSWDPTTSND
jgi:diketogulonate reductase-like aldo/keto reductase